MSNADTGIHRAGMTFTDKVVIITGGLRGIGAGCSRVFVDAGGKVMVCDRNAETGDDFALQLTVKGPGQCAFRRCDVSSPSDVRDMIDATIDRFGRLDCLINNAGFHPPVKRIGEFSYDELMDVWKVNFVSQFIACQHAILHLRKTRGSIINMSSLVGEIGQEGATTYCATKGAVNAFTKSLAIEEAAQGVRVNAVLPGNILTGSRTDLIKSMADGERIDRWVDSNQHANRSGTSEEVAQLCLFLASDAASFITGTLQTITGGAELGYGVKHPTMFL